MATKKKTQEKITAKDAEKAVKTAQNASAEKTQSAADVKSGAASATQKSSSRRPRSSGAPKQFKEKNTAIEPQKVEVKEDVAENAVVVEKEKKTRSKKKAADVIVVEEKDIKDIEDVISVDNTPVKDTAVVNEPQKAQTEKPAKTRSRRKAADVKQEGTNVEDNVENQTAAEENVSENAVAVADETAETDIQSAVAEEIAEQEEEPSRAQEKADKDFRKQNKKVKYVGELERVQPDPSVGLTDEQVQERFGRGMNNVQPNIVSKSYLGIFRSNVLTLFNFINFVLAALIFVYGELKNMLFIGVVTVNIIVGVVQEIRSKKVLEKMSLIAAPHVDLVRNGKVVQS